MKIIILLCCTLIIAVVSYVSYQVGKTAGMNKVFQDLGKEIEKIKELKDDLDDEKNL